MPVRCLLQAPPTSVKLPPISVPAPNLDGSPQFTAPIVPWCSCSSPLRIRPAPTVIPAPTSHAIPQISVKCWICCSFTRNYKIYAKNAKNANLHFAFFCIQANTALRTCFAFFVSLLKYAVLPFCRSAVLPFCSKAVLHVC